MPRPRGKESPVKHLPQTPINHDLCVPSRLAPFLIVYALDHNRTNIPIIRNASLFVFISVVISLPAPNLIAAFIDCLFPPSSLLHLDCSHVINEPQSSIDRIFIPVAHICLEAPFCMADTSIKW